MKKSFLFVFDRPSRGDTHLQETLDWLLTLAAFDRQVALLFLDDGVFLLKKGPCAGIEGMKEAASLFQVLTMYGVEDIRVERESLAERDLTVDDLILPAGTIARCDVGKLLRQKEVTLHG